MKHGYYKTESGHQARIDLIRPRGAYGAIIGVGLAYWDWNGICANEDAQEEGMNLNLSTWEPFSEEAIEKLLAPRFYPDIAPFLVQVIDRNRFEAKISDIEYAFSKRLKHHPDAKCEHVTRENIDWVFDILEVKWLDPPSPEKIGKRQVMASKKIEFDEKNGVVRWKNLSQKWHSSYGDPIEPIELILTDEQEKKYREGWGIK